MHRYEILRSKISTKLSKFHLPNLLASDRVLKCEQNISLSKNKQKWNGKMKKLISITLITLTLSSCGTAQGVMNGVGEVLNGMAVDARSIGSLFN